MHRFFLFLIMVLYAFNNYGMAKNINTQSPLLGIQQELSSSGPFFCDACKSVVEGLHVQKKKQLLQVQNEKEIKLFEVDVEFLAKNFGYFEKKYAQCNPENTVTQVVPSSVSLHDAERAFAVKPRFSCSMVRFLVDILECRNPDVLKKCADAVCRDLYFIGIDYSFNDEDIAFIELLKLYRKLTSPSDLSFKFNLSISFRCRYKPDKLSFFPLDYKPHLLKKFPKKYSVVSSTKIHDYCSLNSQDLCVRLKEASLKCHQARVDASVEKQVWLNPTESITLATVSGLTLALAVDERKKFLATTVGLVNSQGKFSDEKRICLQVFDIASAQQVFEETVVYQDRKKLRWLSFLNDETLLVADHQMKLPLKEARALYPDEMLLCNEVSELKKSGQVVSLSPYKTEIAQGLPEYLQKELGVFS